jgi:hypothetical protein
MKLEAEKVNKAEVLVLGFAAVVIMVLFATYIKMSFFHVYDEDFGVPDRYLTEEEERFIMEEMTLEQLDKMMGND